MSDDIEKMINDDLGRIQKYIEEFSGDAHNCTSVNIITNAEWLSDRIGKLRKLQRENSLIPTQIRKLDEIESEYNKARNYFQTNCECNKYKEK